MKESVEFLLSEVPTLSRRNNKCFFMLILLYESGE
jgi:hypothetical protein